MKFKTIPCFLLSCLIIVLSSCAGSDKDLTIEYDSSRLIGTWKQTSGSLEYHYLYKADKTGKSWLPSDDVNENEGETTKEDEAQAFKWEVDKEVDKAVLLQYHLMETGKYKVPKRYIITELTDQTLKYKDYVASGGRSYSFVKVLD